MFTGLRASFVGATKRIPAGLNKNELGQSRRFASEKQLKSRMNAITNIKKITKAMKMVASAKLRRAEEALNCSRAFSQGLTDYFPAPAVDVIGAAAPTGGASTAPYLVVAVGPDRGLCGSVNGQIARAVRNRALHHIRVGRNLAYIGMGEKVRPTLERYATNSIVVTAAEHSKLKRRTFKQTTFLADLILRTNFEHGELTYNKFTNLMSFENTTIPLISYSKAAEDPKTFEAYEIEGNPDTLENFYDFVMAARLFGFFGETDMVELSQRVNSMTSSSKNAEAMLNKLKLLYNRTRQSKITTELVEIISGATAAEDQQQ